MENLHKFYNRGDLPWVKLISAKYYSNCKLPGQTMKVSFWWRDNLKFLNIYKGISQAEAGLDETLFYSGRTCGIENYCIFYTFIYCHLLLMKTLPSALL
jgi:hypothetical protein